MPKAKRHIGRTCPKCGALVVVVMDDVGGKGIEKCSQCDYRQTKPLKKPPKKG